MKHKNLRLAVKNFGPIREGEVEFKPLTVFIGPNNSGKSYMATLLYVLFQTLKGRRGYPDASRWPVFDLSPEDLEAITQLSMELSAGSAEGNTLISNARSILQNRFDDGKQKIETGVIDVFREYFGCTDLNELIYKSSTDFSVSMFEEDGSTPIFSVEGGSSNSEVAINIERDAPAIVDGEILRILDQATSYSHIHSIFYLLAWRLWRERLLAVGMPEGEVRYLPAGRSGLLQGWQLTASLAVGMLGTRTDMRDKDIEFHSFPGVARDFTQLLISLMSEGHGDRGVDGLVQAVRLLEERVLHGTIHTRTNNNISTIGYQSGDLRLPMQRASSMVSELAPIHLWMSHLLWSGDLLIIDEPEAHLHPENQRLIAQVLVRLMNAGVRVVCATHSSLILHQMSNQILATASGKLDKVGFTEHDKLNLEDIGVYLFDLAEDGARISEVEVDTDFGISEDEFVRVAEQIGEETYQLVI